MASVNCGQLWSKNIKWEIPKINCVYALLWVILNSRMKSCAICSVLPGKWDIPLSSASALSTLPPVCHLVAISITRERPHSQNFYHSILWWLFYLLLVIGASLLLCLIYKLNYCICMGKNIAYVGVSTICSKRHPLGVLECTPCAWGERNVFHQSIVVKRDSSCVLW